MWNIVKAHESFIVDVLLPNVIDHATRSNTPVDEVLLAVFIAFNTFVSGRGYDPAAVLEATLQEWIRDGYAILHDAPEGLQ